jgi:hypothetical protein
MPLRPPRHLLCQSCNKCIPQGLFIGEAVSRSCCFLKGATRGLCVQVEYNSKGVKVYTEDDGREHEAKRLVVTAPLGVLKVSAEGAFFCG